MTAVAILIGAVLYMGIGMAYYSVLGKRWVALLGLGSEQPRYGLLTLVTILASAALFGLLKIADAETVVDGVLLGLLAGVLVALAYAKDFIFGLGASSKKASQVFGIAVGYHVLALTLMGTAMMLIL